MCYLLKLADSVKQVPKTFDIAHFGVHAAHDVFSSPKEDKRIGTLYQFKKNLITPNVNFYE